MEGERELCFEERERERGGEEGGRGKEGRREREREID